MALLLMNFLMTSMAFCRTTVNSS